MDLELHGQTITNHAFGYIISLVTDAGFRLNIENDCTLHTRARS